MSDNFRTIAIIGATSGIGEGMARRYHAQGKTVIATGRRSEKLQSMQKELPGLRIQQMDVSDIPTLPSQITELLSNNPTIDTIVAMSGIQRAFDFTNPSSSSADSLAQEVNTNVLFPALLAQQCIPFLQAREAAAASATTDAGNTGTNAPPAQAGTLILVSSGLAFIPMPRYPLYCPTKAAIHSLAITLRAQVRAANKAQSTHTRVVELAPPYVRTDLDAGHRPEGGGPVQPLGLEAYLDEAMEGLRDEGRGEVGVGFADMGVKMWRGAFQGVLDQRGVDG